MNLEGRLIGNRYEILEKIGVGGMATVYKAKCQVLNRYVAVKILRDEYTTDMEFVKRFNSEAQSAASLTHPNIVSIYDVGNEGNLYYIVMELVQGKTLKEIINADGKLPWKWSTNVAIQIASALEVAHKNNIIHRDIKPHNIIITEEGIAKVADFGIAKAVSNSTITAFGTTIGSVHYFSPEHARGGITDAKSDIYSLGVVLYEMLTGRVPFDADTPVSIALKHMQEEPVEPIKINPNIPVSLNAIILKAMKKDANLRYQSATEMLVDLRNVLKNPDEDFVVFEKKPNDFPTQRIEIVKDNATKKEPAKKKGKLKDFFEKHKFVKALVLIFSAIILLAASFFATYLIANSSRPKEVLIPELVGKTKEEAENTAKQLNIKLEITEIFSEEVEVGKVVSQTPPYMENYKILEKDTVKVSISKGKDVVDLIDVVGKTKEEAEKALKTIGLNLEIIEENNKKVEEGIVIKQEPETSSTEKVQVASKSTVKVYVSKGIAKSTVPNLIGKTEEVARGEIEEAGLKLTTVLTEKDTTKANGVIIKQDIDPGKEVEEETGITITVNEIPEIKTGTVNINLKSLTGYTEEKDANGITISPKDVTLKVTVDGDTIYEKSHKPNTEKVSVKVEGVGTVEIKVFVDTVRKAQQQLNLNSDNPELDIK